MDEFLRIQDTRIYHHRKSFLVANGFHQLSEQGIFHFFGYQGVAQQTAIDGKGGMKRVQAGAYLHFFYFVNGFPVGKYNAAFFQGRAPVGEVIFDYQILTFFRIDEWSDIGVFGGDHRIKRFYAVFGKQGLHLCVRSGGDFVDHGPGKRNFHSVSYIITKAFFGKALFAPGICEGQHGCLQLVAVMGTVVHAHHGYGKAAA